MRRLIATAALGAALFSASACADVPQDKPGSSPSPSQTKATLADKKTSCADYDALEKETRAKLEPLEADLAAAQTDPIKAISALTEVKTLIATQETKLTAITDQAGDAEVKSALQTRLGEVRQLKKDLDAAGTDPVKLQVVAMSVSDDDKKSDPVKAACA